MANEFNGLRVTKRDDTLFVKLPETARTPIEGGCACHYCKQHPDMVPQWDAMAIDPSQEYSHYSWTVHYPELS